MTETALPPPATHKARPSGLLRSSVWVFGARVLVILLGFMVTVIVAQWYGAAATGFVALVNSSALVFGTFAVLGQNTFLVRELSHAGSNSVYGAKRALYLRSLFLVSLVAILGAGPVTFVLRHSFPDPVWTSSSAAIAIVGFALVGRTLVGFAVNSSRALIPAPMYCGLLVLPAALNLMIVGMWGIFSNKAVWVPSAALAIGFCLGGVAAIFISLGRLSRTSVTEHPPQSPSVPPLPALVKLGAPFAIATLSTTLLTEGNIVMAGLFLPASEIGVYSVAHRTSVLASFALMSISLIAQPELARRRADDPHAMRCYARQVSDLIFWATLPIVALLFITRDWVIKTAFGPDFEQASMVLAVLLVGHAAAALTGATNPYLTMTGGQHTIARLTFCAACLSIILTAVLTPYLGLLGPAFATSAALTILNVATLVAIRLRDGFWLCWMPRFARGDISMTRTEEG